MIGDVCGHGALAATTTGLVRHTVRASRDSSATRPRWSKRSTRRRRSRPRTDPSAEIACETARSWRPGTAWSCSPRHAPPARELFGDDRLRRAVADLPAGSKADASAILDAVVRAVAEHIELTDAVADDDQAALILPLRRPRPRLRSKRPQPPVIGLGRAGWS